MLKDEDEAEQLDRDVGRHGEAGGCEAPLAEPETRIAPDGRPTVLIVGAQPQREALARWAERAGLRCIGRIGLDAAAGRLAQTISLDLLLLDLRGIDLAARLDRATAFALAARYGLARARLAVIVDLDGLDQAHALLDAPGTEFLCEPANRDIVSLLVMAGLGESPSGLVLHDTAQDDETGRLEQLSEEVRRLAETIERMTAGGLMPVGMGAVMEERGGYRISNGSDHPGNPGRLFQPRERHRHGDPGGSALPTHAEIRAIIRARRMRDQFLPADLFADPAWDMILDLLAARLAGQRVSVSSLCIAAAVPPTTALRHIRQLTDRAVFARIDDPADGRRVFIELTEAAAQAALAWAQGVRRNGGLLAVAR